MLEPVNVAALSLSVVSCILSYLTLTKLETVKVFRFTVGEVALVTAIAFAFQACLKGNVFSLFLLVFWFVIGSWNFYKAAYPITE